MEEQSDALEREIQEDASLTQADLNVKSQELYNMWDSRERVYELISMLDPQ